MSKNGRQDNMAKQYMPRVLRKYRDEAGLSQQMLADRVGIAKGYVSSLERGVKPLNLNLLVKIAAVLNVPPGDLVNQMVAEASKNNSGFA